MNIDNKRGKQTLIDITGEEGQNKEKPIIVT